MATKVRFTVSIASADWSYAAQQEVEVGTSHTPCEIPADIARVWLEVGHVVAVPDSAPEAAGAAGLPEAAVRPRPRPRGER